MTTTLECFERGTKSFNTHDVEGFAAVLADDVVFEAPGGMRGQGKSACAGFFSGWWAAFPDAHVEVHDLHIIDDVAVEVGTFTGTHHGILHTPAGDLPPTGRPVRVGYTQILRFRDGRHAAFRLMFDRLEMLEQLGLAAGPRDGS